MTRVVKYIRTLIFKVMQKEQHKEKAKQPEKEQKPKESGGTEGQPSRNPNERTTVTKRG